MTIVRIGRASLRMYGVVSCVVLACVDVARADLGGDRTGAFRASNHHHSEWQGVARYIFSGGNRGTTTRAGQRNPAKSHGA